MRRKSLVIAPIEIRGTAGPVSRCAVGRRDRAVCSSIEIDRAEPAPVRQIAELKRYCAQRLSEGFARMPATMYDPIKHSSLMLEALELRPEPWALLARTDLGAAETVRTVAIPTVGDCLAPRLHDGDILFVEIGRHCFEGDLATLSVPPENTGGHFAFTTKLVHKYRDRILLLSSNEPPAWYSSEKQRRFLPVGVVVAAIHYETPTPRSPELQALMDTSAERMRRDYGEDLWSADFLEYHIGHPIAEFVCPKSSR